jgi:hypothetical protein
MALSKAQMKSEAEGVLVAVAAFLEREIEDDELTGFGSEVVVLEGQVCINLPGGGVIAIDVRAL